MLAAIVQARMGSSRLPGKTLADVQGRPMLARFIERLKASRRLEAILLATTLEKRDDPIAQIGKEMGLKTFRGSEWDVLDRIYRAAEEYDVDPIVRVTSDCPLVDPEVLDQVVELYAQGGYDYVCNFLGVRFPDGLDVEVFSRAALARVWKEARTPSEREHVTAYLRNSGFFRIGNLDAPEDFSQMLWSVDHPEDLEFVRAVYARLGNNGHLFGWKEVLELARAEPALSRKNSRGVVNEGYYLSLSKDAPIPPRPHSRAKSESLKKRASVRVPGCSQTFSKGPTQFVQGVAPNFLVRGKGSRVWDADGNEFLDFGMALGAALLGYADADVNAAVDRQMADGAIFSLPHPLEVEVAELLAERVPCAEMVRFGKNGSDATAGAVRLARACTGREIIASCGYHGWQDWAIGVTSRNKGVPETVRKLTVPFAYNDLASLERIFADHPDRVAAVILEPVGVEEPQEGFLQQVQELARRHGALLIFDEVLTGFRLALGGAQEYFGVVPDLACFGKAMANGLPLSAVVGRRDLLQQFEEVFFSFTFGGETLALAAAKATLRKIREAAVIPHLWNQGKKLKDGYNVLARHYGLEKATSCVGYAPRTVIRFRGSEAGESLILQSLFQQECLKRGLLFSGSHNASFAHGEPEVDFALHVYRSALEVLASAVQEGNAAERLEGKPIQPVFRQA